MRITSPLVHQLGGLASAGAIAAWMRTMDCRVAYYDPSVDPTRRDFAGGQRIYVFWHEYLLFPVYMRGHCNLTMLVSQHRDADLLVHAARHLGFSFVRGSSTRGGVSALRELMDTSARMNLAITPDGPRGPRRVLAQGAVYLSSRLGLPIVCIGMGWDRPWRFKSWDRFALPRPYSRGRGIIGPQQTIPANLDRDGLEHYRIEVERMLNRLTHEAEQWAASGVRRTVGEPLHRAQARGHLRGFIRSDVAERNRIAAPHLPKPEFAFGAGLALGAGLPTPPPPPTAGLPSAAPSAAAGDLRSTPWQGQETLPQLATTGDLATTGAG